MPETMRSRCLRPRPAKVPEAFQLATPDVSDYVRVLRGMFSEDKRAELWRNRIGGEGFKIGICWQGGPGNPARSFPLFALEEIAAQPGVRLISLQKQAESGQLNASPMDVETLGEDYDADAHGFLDAAAVMETIRQIECHSGAHLLSLTSMALRNPSLIKLKHIEVMKIIRPGRAAT